MEIKTLLKKTREALFKRLEINLKKKELKEADKIINSFKEISINEIKNV